MADPDTSPSLLSGLRSDLGPDHHLCLLTGEGSGTQWNLCLWDGHSGAALHAYKGGVTKVGTVAVLRDTFVVSARPDKPLLNVWQTHR